LQLAGNVKQGGLIELPFGSTLQSLLNDFSGGTESGRPIRAIQVGGPLGAYLPTSKFDIPLDYEAFTMASAVLGHGGIVIFDDTVDMLEQARFSMEFCVDESCGKCTPCRIGSTRGVEVIDKIKDDDNRAANMVLLSDLCETMVNGSLCAMGSMTPIPVTSAYKDFSEDFDLPSSNAVLQETNHG
jgi:formate dehydrogenase iron-sulfur subunit